MASANVTLSTGFKTALLASIGATSGLAATGIMHLGKIYIYNNAPPATADADPASTLLGTVTVNAGGTGLTWEAAAAGLLEKETTEIWQFVGAASGTATWGRFVAAGGTPTGSSTSEKRLDFLVGKSGTPLVMSDTAIVSGATHTIQSASFVFAG